MAGVPIPIMPGFFEDLLDVYPNAIVFAPSEGVPYSRPRNTVVSPGPRYPPETDVDCVRVRPLSGVQTVEQRFGPNARRRIHSFLGVGSNTGITGMYHPDSSDDGDMDDITDSGSDMADNVATDDAEGDIDSDADGDAVGGAVGDDADSADASDDDASDGDAGNDIPNLGFDPSHIISGIHGPAAPSLNPYGAGGGDDIVEIGGTWDADIESGEGFDDLAAIEFMASQYITSATQPGRSHVPYVSRARINLTALSQKFNLFFVVYQDTLHVYRPQPAPEILQGPLLTLYPPPTKAGIVLGGYQSDRFPHQVNHMIVGDLGGLEIVLMAYDDGDVVAYYTHHIIDYINDRHRSLQRDRHSKRGRCGKRARLSLKKPEPFFHTTVGKSAWGLAVHSQSRLIAVSSNLAEVTVFAFALRRPSPGDPLQHKTQPLDVPDSDVSPTTYSGASALELESELRLRNREWRILLPLGEAGSNIPNIDFIDDKNGNADKVIAIDVTGCTWILEIWKVGSRPFKIDPPERAMRAGQGWAILTIPRKCLIPTNKLPKRRCADLARSMYSNMPHGLHYSYDNDPIQLAPKSPPVCFDTAIASNDSDNDISIASDNDETSSLWYDCTDESEESDEVADASSEESSGESADEVDAESALQSHYGIGGSYNFANTNGSYTYDPKTMPRDWTAISKRSSPFPNEPGMIDSSKEEKFEFHQNMIICPSIGMTWAPSNLGDLVRILKNSHYRQHRIVDEHLHRFQGQPWTDVDDMARRFFFLRTFSVGAELFNVEHNAPSYHVKAIVRSPYRIPPDVFDMHERFHRCSMVHFIPEISLIIVGNMFGRVVLLRPLKNNRAKTSPEYAPWAFRTEWTLPLERDEAKRNRPGCCLLGIAVSPVPEPGASRYGMVRAAKRRHHPTIKPQRRWRLIMHYMDHTILQYYIEERSSGAAETGVLSV